MPNLLDYVKHHKDSSFKDFPLNELDIAAINEIGYLSFDDLVEKADSKQFQFDLEDILQPDQENQKETVYNFLITKERVDLFRAMRESMRFKNMKLSHYVNDVDDQSEKQFAALVFTIDTINHTQVVFRGTDDSMVGWKEDFKMTYMREIPAHRSAIAYLTTYLINYPDKEVVISGHSKGGNLALYAATFISKTLQERIKRVYHLDAPGLAEDFLKSSGYQSIRDRLIVIRPQESIVGVMLYLDVKPKIVKAESFGLLQHKTINWQVHLDGRFETVAHATDLSKNLEMTFRDWTNQLSKQDLKLLCDSFFDSLIASGITSLNVFTFDDRAFKQVFTVIGSLRSIDRDKKIIMLNSMRQLIHDYSGYRKREFSEKIQTRMSQIMAKAPSRKLF